MLKPTDFKQDEILFRAFSLGGTSLATDRGLRPGRNRRAGDVGHRPRHGSTRSSSARCSPGKIASVRPSIGETEEGLCGSGSPKDLETLFQLIYLHFTRRAPMREAFAAYIAQGKTVLANQKASPIFAFSDALQSTLSQNHPRARVMTAEMVDELNLEKSLAFYKDRFADASDFTFVFVGHLQPRHHAAARRALPGVPPVAAIGRRRGRTPASGRRRGSSRRS